MLINELGCYRKVVQFATTRVHNINDKMSALMYKYLHSDSLISRACLNYLSLFFFLLNRERNYNYFGSIPRMVF